MATTKRSKAKKTPSRNAAKAKKTKAAAPKIKGALASVRKRLLAMREDLMDTVRRKELPEAVGGDAGDSVDQASQAIEKELIFELSDNERSTLDQIEAALRKIEKGTYGFCESCRRPIGRQRLSALPFARYCISCQSGVERVPESAEEALPELHQVGEEAGREL